MHWYNPKTRGAENIHAPKSDEAALEMLSGDPNPWKFVEQYVTLREEGTSVGRALIFMEHHWRMFHTRFEPVG